MSVTTPTLLTEPSSNNTVRNAHDPKTLDPHVVVVTGLTDRSTPAIFAASFAEATTFMNIPTV